MNSVLETKFVRLFKSLALATNHAGTFQVNNKTRVYGFNM